MATTYLSRTFGSAGNQQIFTFSAWVKFSDDDNLNYIFSTGADAENRLVLLRHNSATGSTLKVDGKTATTQTIEVRTNRAFRDLSAWYHIVLAVDTTQSTSSDRVKIYVNGVQETSFAQSTYPSQNYNTEVNKASAHYIGKVNIGTTYYNGSMSHIHFADGTAYPASTFGSTDATTGEWKINTSPTMTMGTNGFTILKDGNTITDQSSNSNNFTLSAGTLTKTEDNPSNVYCVLNELSKVSGVTLASGNTTCQCDNTSFRSVMGTLGMSAGKYYWEAKVLSLGTINFGITQTKQDGTTHSSVDATRIMYSSNGIVYRNALGDSVDTGTTFTTNDIIGISLDCDNGILKFYKNDSLIHTTTNSVITNNEWTPANGLKNAHGAMNFGNGYFNTTAVSSAGTNASGIGIFEYDVKPSDATALSTKGLNL